MGDRVQSQPVLMNLMLNGIDAMKDMDGTRDLAIKSQGGQLLISVDTGVHKGSTVTSPHAGRVSLMPHNQSYKFRLAIAQFLSASIAFVLATFVCFRLGFSLGTTACLYLIIFVLLSLQGASSPSSRSGRKMGTCWSQSTIPAWDCPQSRLSRSSIRSLRPTSMGPAWAYLSAAPLLNRMAPACGLPTTLRRAPVFISRYPPKSRRIK